MISSLAILGSTGSIGTQALEVCHELGITVTALSCGRNTELLKKQILTYSPNIVSVTDEKDAADLQVWARNQRNADLSNLQILHGEEGNLAVASDPNSQMVLAAMVGMAGLKPVIQALETGHHIALANKETLVAGGDVVMDLAAKNKLELRPVDSEHSAIWQCLKGASNQKHELEKILLTASGGPFRGHTMNELKHVTVEQALNHPTWKMGGKITIDSATLMNKGLELIEAMHLFDVQSSMIDIVVHPESIIHSAVAYRDGAVIAQLGYPDMKLPIRLALTWPERKGADLEYWNPLKEKQSALTFEAPDRETFRCLALAEQAASQRGDSPVILNASNEIAVAAFLEGELSFVGIAEIVEESLHRLAGRSTGMLMDPDLIESIDVEARAVAKQLITAR